MMGFLKLCLFTLFVLNLQDKHVSAEEDVMTNNWHVIFKRDVDHLEASSIASRNGFQMLMPIMNSKREYHFIHPGVEVHHLRSKRSVKHTERLLNEANIERATQISGFRRVKRGYKNLKDLELDSELSSKQDISEDESKNNIGNKDPLYEKEWYIKNNGQAGGIKGLDLNAETAWKLGYTGKNITTAIMDDGVDYMHPDLFDNFNAEASYDFSSNDNYPYPRFTDDWFNSHGTRCAGEIASKRGNGICGVGVAYNSKIAGLRMLDQPYMTDLIEASSMSHRPDLIDIYSASWGPTDDGKTVDGPRNATMRAIVKGVNEGRNGYGSIYVWASGDGGPDDDCNCDGYAASMWTISINSATNDGQTASYDESCSSTLASTFSNGKPGYKDAGVATTDLYGKCTTKHSGTSAAAPEAAGVFALALEANPKLTWRDVQHLTVLTSKRNHLEDPKVHHKWTMNGAGLEFNHLFGYGVLDAGDMVTLAKDWKTVPERFHCTAGSLKNAYKFSTRNGLKIQIDTNGCKGQKNQVNYLEHVQSFITLNSTRRGNVNIYLTSPMNTTSLILSTRPNDNDMKDGFNKWPFMTTHSWAENSRGIWTLFVTFDSNDQKVNKGTLFEWTLMLHGTQKSSYTGQTSPLIHNLKSKLGVVKRQHESAKEFQL